MAASNIVICNLALLKIGAQKISALTDNTAEADACEFFYARTLQAILQEYDWPFATVAADLGAATETEVSGWSYEYDLPADCLRPIRLEEEGEDGSGNDGPAGIDDLEKYEIRGTKLLTDLEDAWLIYVQDFTDTTAFPLAFEDALVHKLASELAMPLTGNPDIARDLYQMAELAMRKATSIEADIPSFIPVEGDYLKARD